MKKTGSLKDALAKYGQGGNKVLRVGFFESATYANADGESLPVAQVAAWNEFGTESIPPRPFFRTTIRENKKNWVNSAAKLSKEHGTDKALALVGEHIKGQLTESITSWTEPPNAPATVKKKGFDAPLRDTMTMARSIGVEVSDDES